MDHGPEQLPGIGSSELGRPEREITLADEDRDWAMHSASSACSDGWKE